MAAAAAAATETTTEDDSEFFKVDLSLLDSWKQSLLPSPPTELEKLTSREAIQSRLRTFLPLTYFCKPASLSPLVCARFGWINTTVDMIKCSSCQAALVVKIHPKIKQQSTILKLVQAYQAKLATAHKPSCPFRLEAKLHLFNDNNSINTEGVIVPSHFVNILPEDIWEMLERPKPLPLLQARLKALLDFILGGNLDDHDGHAPKWNLPRMELPEEVLQFGVFVNNQNSRQRRMLAKLAFDPHNPYSARGYEQETLWTRLDDILMPHSEEDEIRAQTRSMEEWEDFYESTAALALLGWEARSKKEEGQECHFVLQCCICMSTLKLTGKKHEGHSSPTRRSARTQRPKKQASQEEEDETKERPSKRRRIATDSDSFNPLMAHRYHCPFMCGFPRDGARKTTPVWQIVAEKLLADQKLAAEGKTDEDAIDDNKFDEDGDKATDKILKLLRSGLSSLVGKSKDAPPMLSL